MRGFCYPLYGGFELFLHARIPSFTPKPKGSFFWHPSLFSTLRVAHTLWRPLKQELKLTTLATVASFISCSWIKSTIWLWMPGYPPLWNNICCAGSVSPSSQLHVSPCSPLYSYSSNWVELSSLITKAALWFSLKVYEFSDLLHKQLALKPCECINASHLYPRHRQALSTQQMWPPSTLFGFGQTPSCLDQFHSRFSLLSWART